MQQKSKFIIFISLICFISLLFLPVKVRGASTPTDGGGGSLCCLEVGWTPSGCTVGIAGWTCNAPGTSKCCTGSGCIKWDTTSPECVTTTPTTTKEKDKWCCNNSTGSCYKCSKTGAWSTQAQCEACCPTGTYFGCRKSAWSWLSGNQTLYCKLMTWCEVDPGDKCQTDADCNNETPPPTSPKYTCDTSTWQCYEDSNGNYTSLSSCEEDCVDSSPPPETTYSGYYCSGPKYSCSVYKGGLCKKCLYSSNLTRPGYSTKAECEENCQYRCQCTSGNWCRCAKCPDTGPCETCTYNSDCVSTTDTTDTTTTTEPTATKYTCDTDTWTCSESADGVYATEAVCEENCVEPTTQRYSGWKCRSIGCNTSSEFCRKCRYSSSWTSTSGLYDSEAECEENCEYKCRCINGYCYCKKCPSSGPCEKECKTSSDCVSTTDTTTDTTSPPPTSRPPAPKCQIFEFSINGKTNEDRDPLYVWVNALLKGYVSVNDSCTKCTVTSDDTWGNPSKDYTITSISTDINESFKIPESGTYFFTVKCIGDPADPDDFDEDKVSLKTVRAINLPWWREIIPVLPGFLRGIWR